MKYNLGMNQLTLVLPFALPPPEMARDLQRALQTPALEALLSRTSAHQFAPFDNALRMLPHEAWLAQALKLAPVEANAAPSAAFAAGAMRGFNLEANDGHWFIVNPVHVQIARNHLLMDDPRQLRLSEADARALFDCAKPYFDEIKQPLLYGDAHTWFMRADAWKGLQTGTLDAAIGQNLVAWMPEGPSGRACRKLQNEIQMLWHDHPVNLQRQQRGLKPINAFWLWGGADADAAVNHHDAPLLVGDGEPWLAALGQASAGADLETMLTIHSSMADGGALVVLGTLNQAGLASDWSHWLMQMQQLEQQWFAPALQALKQGRIKRCTLVLSNRDAHAEFSSSKYAQRKFWQKITLNRLST
jgi:hypothetical protein